MTVADRVLQFTDHLARTALEPPPGFAVVNPFSGPGRDGVREVTTAFYRRFYDDCRPRRLVLGSSPARRGTAVTGVPFASAQALGGANSVGDGVAVDDCAGSRTSAGFIDEVIRRCGGRDRFYADFVMGFVCPLGVVRTKAGGGAVNANYYENTKLLETLRSFIVDTLRRQLAFKVDASVCYCIGSGGNFGFLSELNAEECLFETIVPLEHPRFITQYHPGRWDESIEKYVRVLRGTGN